MFVSIVQEQVRVNNKKNPPYSPSQAAEMTGIPPQISHPDARVLSSHHAYPMHIRHQQRSWKGVWPYILVYGVGHIHNIAIYEQVEHSSCYMRADLTNATRSFILCAQADMLFPILSCLLFIGLGTFLIRHRLWTRRFNNFQRVAERSSYIFFINRSWFSLPEHTSVNSV